MPCVTGRSSFFIPTVDICHGVGAALDVGAEQEGAAVVTNLLYPTKNQVGFSVKEKTKTNISKLNPRSQKCNLINPINITFPLDIQH